MIKKPSGSALVRVSGWSRRHGLLHVHRRHPWLRAISDQSPTKEMEPGVDVEVRYIDGDPNADRTCEK